MKKWKQLSKFNILSMNTSYTIFKCKYCNHLSFSEFNPCYYDPDMSLGKYYDSIPEWFLNKLTEKQKKELLTNN